MNTKSKHEDYLEKAKALSRVEAEQLFSRMRGKLARRMGDRKLDPLDAIARQLAFEDEQLSEWRQKVAEIRQKSKH
ncbi:MAG: hypothetical protein D4R84_12290 [Rhodocyclaceae bacterium]|nr:MAG: hypothetical protein D4R84_12290 [Rhodocyclaceae bacterium]